MSEPRSVSEDDLTKRLVRIIDKAASDLRRVSTLSYRDDSLVSLNTALDKVCNGVSLVISDLEQRPDV